MHLGWRQAIGGAAINVFATITMTGVRLLTKDGLPQRTASIAGLSIALGMGIALTSEALAGPGMPEQAEAFIGRLKAHERVLAASTVGRLVSRKDPQKLIFVR